MDILDCCPRQNMSGVLCVLCVCLAAAVVMSGKCEENVGEVTRLCSHTWPRSVLGSHSSNA